MFIWRCAVAEQSNKKDIIDARGEGVVPLPPACQALLAGALQCSQDVVGWSGSRGTRRCDVAVLCSAQGAVI